MPAARGDWTEDDNASASVAISRSAYGVDQQQPSKLPVQPRAMPIHPSQIKICPSLNETLACINCISPDIPESSGGAILAHTRKLGPILLELRRLELAAQEEQEEFFTTRTIGLSRGNPSLGTSVASTCLDLPTYGQGPVAGATGLTTGALCIHTFGNGRDEDGFLTSSIEYFHTPRHHRQASAVAWRPKNSNHVAIGLEGGAGPQQASGNRRSSGAGIRTGGDREFCCFLWDIEAQQSSSTKRLGTPLHKLAHNASVASLAWLLEGQTLAVGGQLRNIQLYDMRVSGANAPPISAYAHDFGVHGIEVDPNRPHLMATYSRSVGEAVKLWDIRRMDSVVSEIKISVASKEPTVVSSVKWSTQESGLLSVAIGSSVHDYDTTSSGSRPILLRVNQGKGQAIMDVALYERPKIVSKVHEEATQSNRLIAQLYPRRMLTVLKDKTVCDMAKHTYAPLAISRRNGQLVHALGRTLWVGSTSQGEGSFEC
jgi:hypothetical protein